MADRLTAPGQGWSHHHGRAPVGVNVIVSGKEHDGKSRGGPKEVLVHALERAYRACQGPPARDPREEERNARCNKASGCRLPCRRHHGASTGCRRAGRDQDRHALCRLRPVGQRIGAAARRVGMVGGRREQGRRPVRQGLRQEAAGPPGVLRRPKLPVARRQPDQPVDHPRQGGHPAVGQHLRHDRRRRAHRARPPDAAVGRDRQQPQLLQPRQPLHRAAGARRHRPLPGDAGRLRGADAEAGHQVRGPAVCHRRLHGLPGRRRPQGRAGNARAEPGIRPRRAGQHHRLHPAGEQRAGRAARRGAGVRLPRQRDRLPARAAGQRHEVQVPVHRLRPDRDAADADQRRVRPVGQQLRPRQPGRV